MQYFTAGDGVRLAYEDSGAGTGLPVLCLAGLTRNMRDFDFVAPHLHDVRLIRMDYRGRGASDRADPASYTVQQEGADALALLDHLGVAQAAILGTSRGGLIGMGLAALARNRLLGLCLNDIGPELDISGLEVIKSYLGKPPAARTLDEAARMRGAFMAAAGFDNVPPERWRHEVSFMYRETATGLALNYDPELRRTLEVAEAGGLPDLWPVFAALKGLPLAVIHGLNSNLLSRATVQRMQEIQPQMLVAGVPGRGHAPFLDEPGAVRVIQQWLDQMR